LIKTGLKSLSILLRSKIGIVGDDIECFVRLDSVAATAYAALISSFEAAGEGPFAAALGSTFVVDGLAASYYYF